ncbi:hypothetical protein [Sulfidibacter corallicola]|uniref:Uncharacterized protein n=1 Tax=Sulfidibacter corallicola TaxID=2818388 RepID=A0A8A4TI31_SULCO|nr:hypothetical protein [Sulfidibacter corallicola]QTD49220.1 hypothetical protein J3U87_26850 [Sulfidibacter corallicola]
MRQVGAHIDGQSTHGRLGVFEADNRRPPRPSVRRAQSEGSDALRRKPQDQGDLQACKCIAMIIEAVQPSLRLVSREYLFQTSQQNRLPGRGQIDKPRFPLGEITVGAGIPVEQNRVRPHLHQPFDGVIAHGEVLVFRDDQTETGTLANQTIHLAK